MSEVGGELPKGWATGQLSELGDVICGQSPPSSTVNHEGNGVPYISGPEHWDGMIVHGGKWTTAPTRVVPAGTVFVTVKGAGVGTLFPGVEAAIGRDIYAFQPDSSVPTAFVVHALRFTIASIVAQAQGDIPGLSKGHLLDHSIPIPPAQEQARIAEEIDELLSGLMAGVAAVERAQAKLKLFRASVLKSAVEGALTAEWREQNPSPEPASDLLQRILAERRTRWEETQLQKYEQTGKAPPRNWKEKYKEPIAPDDLDLPVLPNGWTWSSLDQFCTEIRNGWSRRPDSDSGVPILRISSVRQLSLNLDDTRNLSGEGADYTGFLIEEDDLLFTRYNGTPSLVGVCALVPALTKAIVHPDKLIRCRPIRARVNPRYAALASNVGASRTFLAKRIRTTAGQAGISGGDLKHLPIPLPPFTEQNRIAEIVAEQLSVIDHLEADLEAKLKSAQALRQAILQRAFSGHLVPQDPNDEPASELLKRISAERETRDREARAQKKASRTTGKGRARRQA